MRVNATGLFAITRAFGDEMAKNKQGSIINISSSTALVAAPNASAEYTFHKGGMISFTRLVASCYGPSNVRCNCISPGAFGNENTPAEFYKVYSSKTMLGRMVDSTDLMGVTVFLASDALKFITGVNIPVEGGYTAL